MNLEDIKKRNERRKVLMKERENEYSLVREIEYNRLVEGSVEDNAYLLSIIERQEKALKDAKEALDNQYRFNGGIIENNKAYMAIFNELTILK